MTGVVLDQLKEGLRGELIDPRDPEYDSRRRAPARHLRGL